MRFMRKGFVLAQYPMDCLHILSNTVGFFFKKHFPKQVLENFDKDTFVTLIIPLPLLIIIIMRTLLSLSFPVIITSNVVIAIIIIIIIIIINIVIFIVVTITIITSKPSSSFSQLTSS